MQKNEKNGISYFKFHTDVLSTYSREKGFPKFSAIYNSLFMT